MCPISELSDLLVESNISLSICPEKCERNYLIIRYDIHAKQAFLQPFVLAKNPPTDFTFAISNGITSGIQCFRNHTVRTNDAVGTTTSGFQFDFRGFLCVLWRDISRMKRICVRRNDSVLYGRVV